MNIFNKKVHLIVVIVFACCLLVNCYHIMDAIAEVSDKASRLNALLGNAISQFNAGNHNSAIEYLDQIEHLYKDIPLSEKQYFDEKRKEIDKWKFTIISLKCRQIEDFPCAIENSQKFLELIENDGDKKVKANVLFHISTLYDIYYRKQSTGYEKALEYYNQAKTFYSDLGDFRLASLMDFHIYYLIGFKLSKEKKLQEAREFYQKSSEIAEDLKDKSLQEFAWMRLGLIDLEIFGLYSSIYYNKKLLDLYRLTNAKGKECKQLQMIADSYFTLGNFNEALAYYKDAINIAREIKDSSEEIEILMRIAEVYFKSGDFQESIDYLQHILKFAKKVKNRKMEANAHRLLGNFYEWLENWEKAIDENLKSINIKDDTGDEDGKPEIYRSVAACYRELAKKQGIVKKPEDDLFLKSIEYYKKALNEYRKLGNLKAEGDVYAEMSRLARTLPDRSIAEYYIKKAIEIHTEAKSMFNIMKDFYYAGETYYLWGNYSQSLVFLQKGLDISRSYGSILWEYHFLKQIGSVYAELKDFELTDENFKKALTLAENMGFMHKAITLGDLGWVAEKTGKYENAAHYLSESIKIMEQKRDSIKLDEIRISYDSIPEKKLIYESMVNVLMKTGETDRAFEYLERMKSRTFLDQLGSKIRLNKKRDMQLSKEERELQWKINSLQQMIEKEQAQPKEKHAPALNTWKKKIDDLRNEYVNLIIKIKHESPELSSLVSVDPLTLKEVQGLLDYDTTLLEYLVTHDKTFLWVVDKSSLNVIEIPVKNKDLFDMVNKLRENIINHSENYKDDAKKLYKILIEPAKPYIKTRRVAIAPHSALHYLPFHALVADSWGQVNKTRATPKFLIEEYDIFYLPSASVLKFVFEKRKPFTGKVLAFGNPYLGDQRLDLPHAEEEVANIKSVYPQTSYYLKKKATKKRVVDLSALYNVIHFATHGELNASSPLFSNIRLASTKDDSGRLEVHEIFNLNLENSALVILSACETGLGKLTEGDEYVGLTRAFIYAGTPSVVASLWKVNDRSTAEFMKLFYRNLKIYPKSEALRKAQLEMINGKTGKGIVRGVGGITTDKTGAGNKKAQKTVNGSHPYFWAPFVLFGDWK
ncbi:MAG TPA: CHAT domain-containing protein [Syntrophorhabdaceae bacterium]|nr:CHAT domain-containing protein [Syntrophorhabdaceae bacterium]HPL41792.1 CHAT domain-containing protein [Syntrophorhabdaceae bacterium]